MFRHGVHHHEVIQNKGTQGQHAFVGTVSRALKRLK
jgi:hypothetical protein